MKTIGHAIVAAVVLWLGVGPADALAQANRTFVSGHGSDGNPCRAPPAVGELHPPEPARCAQSDTWDEGISQQRPVR